MRKFYQKKRLFYQSVYRFLTALLLILTCHISALAQCPPNIDFEQGDFTGWQCWIGSHYILPGGRDTVDVGTLVPPTPGRHDMLSAIPGNGRDPFGNFPVNCPNGSGHSIRLGNTSGGHQAEGVSYTFTIPPGQNQFNLIYHYAVVFQGPQHLDPEQPKLVIEITNVTDGTILPCSSFDFFYSTTTPLNGFYLSRSNNTGTPVWCKSWAANSINLDGNAGKTIKLLFKSADCVFTAHFGYAYIDVNTQCSSAFTGATFCPDDTLVNVTAPSGYQNYQWFSLTNPNLGNQQTLVLNPPPLSGDSVFVELTPFSGYGCLDTLKAYLRDTLTVTANAGPDRETCDNNLVQIGSPPIPGLVYRWTPVTGLSDPNISNPLASPSGNTTYNLTVTNNGGGCATPDMVNVSVDILSDSLELIGVASYCIGSGKSAALRVLPADSIQWYKDNVAIPGANQTLLNITQTGAYYATQFSSAGCTRTTAIKQINIWEAPKAGFGTNTAIQCNAGNQFVFTNSSTLTTGVLNYTWDLGDNNSAGTMDVTHSYTSEGNYTVKLIVTAPGGCKDSSTFDVVVKPSPISSFVVDTPEQCFKNNSFLFTNKSTVTSGILTHTWDFGDGLFDNNPSIAHNYLLPGIYQVTLTATETNGGCIDDSTFSVIVHQSPITNFVVNNATQCFPGHQFILTNNTSILSDTLLYNWYMGDGMGKQDKEFNYSYAKAGNYKMKLLASTLFGCKDSTFADVIIHPTPSADFTIKSVCENLQVPIINRTFNNTTSTVNYLWDFSNGHFDNVNSPVYSYPAPGNYTVRLSVSTAQCPVSFDTKSIDVIIEDQLPGIVYPDKDAAFNFNEPLQARLIGNSAIWTPPTSLSNRFSFTPTFYGLTPQLYTVQIKSAAGCITVDTQLVKTHKKIEIYVPTAFTPNGNGINERLRPTLIGFSKVNYFRIYDRWGKMLYTMNSDQPGWDGRFAGKLVELQTVVWMIEAADVDGVVHHKQGSTVLIR